MAALGNVSLREVETPRVAVAASLTRFVFAFTQTLLTRAPSDPFLAAHYRLAGTQNIGAGYVIPSLGQLWPRGARGEIQG